MSQIDGTTLSDSGLRSLVQVVIVGSSLVAEALKAYQNMPCNTFLTLEYAKSAGVGSPL